MNFDKLSLRQENQAFLSDRGVVIYLEATVDTLLQRTIKDKKRPVLQGKSLDERKGVFEAMLSKRSEIYAALADVTVSTDQQNII